MGPVPPRCWWAYITPTMAEIVVGIGSSHSPMLSIDHAVFPGLAARDRANPAIRDFDGLVREKAGWIDRELAPEIARERHDACQAALARLAQTLTAARLDTLVVIGDDQNEWF